MIFFYDPDNVTKNLLIIRGIISHSKDAKNQQKNTKSQNMLSKTYLFPIQKTAKKCVIPAAQHE